MQLSKEKRPTEYLFWVAPQSKLEEFIDRVLNNKGNEDKGIILIDEEEIM